MRNTFSNFVVSKSNYKAFEYANKIAKQVLTDANPLVFYGPHGCGKSHLLDAIWHDYVLNSNEHATLTSAIGFEEYIKISKFNINYFIDRDKDISLIMINDIDKIDDKKNGEYLAEIIDMYIKARKQVCLTSNKAPSEFCEELSGIFAKGKCIELPFPTKEERKDYYRKVSSKNGEIISGEDAFEYLCEKQKDYREMKCEILKIKIYLIESNNETGSVSIKSLNNILENYKKGEN